MDGKLLMQLTTGHSLIGFLWTFGSP